MTTEFYSVPRSHSMILLDTNIVSYIFNRDTRASYYLKRIRGARAVISFQTVEELWYGAYSRKWGERLRSELARHLERYEVIWPTPELLEISAQLRAERESAGRRLTRSDAWIAATAIMLDCPLASNDKDFRAIPGLELIRRI